MSTWGSLSGKAQGVIASRNREVGEEETGWLGGTADAPSFVTFVHAADDQGMLLAAAPPPETRTVMLIPAEEFDYEVDGDGPPAEIGDQPAIRAYIETDQLSEPAWRPQWAPEPVEAAPGWTGGGPVVDAGDGAPLPPIPPVVDHRGSHSSVKDQGQERGTCVSHATCGLLESIGQRPSDLSEQMMHYQFMEDLGISHANNTGIRTTDAPRILTDPRRYTCTETEWPYIAVMGTITAAVAAGNYAPPPDAVQQYGLVSHTIIGDTGLDQASVKNTRYLESLLAAGRDIVIGVWASWQPSPIPGVIAPVLVNGQPASNGGHAMLVVGYNQPSQYFIVKNSWGSTWEHAGYGYFSYDFVRACAKYGFIVTDPVPA